VNHNNAVIVGAGPVGLIAAHELARRNIPVRLLEKRPGPSHTSRAFTLHARTMEMFEHIGVAHRIEEVSLPCPGNVYHFPGMSEEEKPRTDFRTLPTRYSFYYKINQNDVEQVLREHLRAHYGIVPEYNHEFTDLNCRHNWRAGHGQGAPQRCCGHCLTTASRFRPGSRRGARPPARLLVHLTRP
jgi:2-polyprenyl-6-methoxyphenol hydroxylase-like FAD-dependent oxidoreductase